MAYDHGSYINKQHSNTICPNIASNSTSRTPEKFYVVLDNEGQKYIPNLKLHKKLDLDSEKCLRAPEVKKEVKEEYPGVHDCFKQKSYLYVLCENS